MSNDPKRPAMLPPSRSALLADLAPSTSKSDAALVLGEAGAPSAALAGSPVAVVTIWFAWAMSGLIVAGFLGRRGHDGRPLAVLGIVFGPLLAGLGFDLLRRDEHEVLPLPVSLGDVEAGPTSVLVVLAGPVDELRGVVSALDEISDHVGRVTLVRTAPYESVADGLEDPAVGRAVDHLVRARAAIAPMIQPATLVLAGRAERATVAYLGLAPHDQVIVAGGSPRVADAIAARLATAQVEVRHVPSDEALARSTGRARLAEDGRDTA